MILAGLVVLPLLAGACIWALAPADGERTRGVLAIASAVALLATLALAVAAATTGAVVVWPWGAGLDLRLAIPPIAAAVAIAVPVVAVATTLYATVHEPLPGLRRQIGLLVAFTGAMELVIVAADLLTVTIGWELVAAISWGLIGHEWRDESRPGRAAHAFNVTRAGGLGLFVAAGAAFAVTGSLAYADLSRLDGTALHVVAAGVVVAAVTKSAQVPFAPWLFSAMAGPTPVSALLHSATMVAAGAYLLIRLQPDLEPTGWFGPLVLGVGLATAVTGGVVASVQYRAKHLLAASTSAQYGLMLVAIGAGFPVAAAAHLVAHAAFKSLLFLAAGVAISAVGSDELGRMRLGSHRRATAGLAAVGSLALAAVPPLGAAWTKEQVVAAATHAHVLAGVVTILAGGLSAVYIARFQIVAFGPTAGAGSSPRDLRHPPGRAEVAAMAWLALATVALSLLWLPSVEHALGRVGALPAGQTWELIASWTVVLMAIYAAIVGDRLGWLARLGTTGRLRQAGDWLGLPLVAKRVVADPSLWLAAAAARFDARVIDAGVRAAARCSLVTAAVAGRFDDRVLDAGVRAAARRSLVTAAVAGRFDDRVLDTAVRGIARLSVSTATLAGRADRQIVDAGVRGIAAATRVVAERWTRLTELGIDGLVCAVAGGFAWSARDLRRLQTGAAHHYLTIVTIGAAVAVLVTAVWS